MPTQKVEIVMAHDEPSQTARGFALGEVVICTGFDGDHDSRLIGEPAVVGRDQVVFIGGSSAWLHADNFDKFEFRRLRPGEVVTITRE